MIEHRVRLRGIHYLADLLLPLLLLFAARRSCSCRDSRARPQPALGDAHAGSIHHHYTAGLIPPLIAATVLGAARIAPWGARRAEPARGNRRRRGARRELRARRDPALARSPRRRVLPGLRLHVSAHDRVAERALELIPDDAVVSATNSLGSHLSARARSSASPSSRTRSGSPPTRRSRATPTARARRGHDDRRPAPAKPDWRLVFSEDGVLVFKRRTSRT